MKNGICVKCKSHDVTVARPIDNGHGGSQKTLSLATYQAPNAWFFKGEKKYNMVSYFCGDCGYVEFYLEME